MSYCFRLRFRTPNDSAISTEECQVFLGKYLLRALNAQSLKDARWLELKGGGYATEVEALRDGARAKEALMYAGGASQVGVDCGEDKATGHVNKMLKLKLEKKTGKPVYDGIHGLAAYPEVEATFVDVRADVSVGRSIDRFRNAFIDGLENLGPFSDRQMIALELINGYQFEAPTTNRLLLAITAIEVLCERPKRSRSFIGLVDEILRAIEGQDGDSAEKARLKGLVAREKVESIGTSCRLRIQGMLGKDAARRFKVLYEQRSDAIHEGRRLPRASSAPHEAYQLAWRLLEAELRKSASRT